MRRLVLFCDESIETGAFYSNFFGAALVEEKRLAYVNATLRAKFSELNLNNEVKFTRITANYQTKYEALMSEFFKLIAAGEVKVRIMFTQNINLPQLTADQKKKNGYFLLYYQLIKHSFGWQYMDDPGPYTLLLNCDVFPQTKADIVEFKEYLVGLKRQPEFLSKGLIINEQDIAEVESHKHEVLQCLDVLMGSMQCKLNEGHKVKTPGTRYISKRAKAKEAVYKVIRAEITKLYPGYLFNAGETTNFHPDPSTEDLRCNRWTLPYKHWKFVPRLVERNIDYIAKNR